MFSQNFIAKVKDATNLLDLVKEHVEVKPAGVNKWQSRCTHPDHSDSTPSFRVWKNKEKDGRYSWSWACMGCHQGRKSAKFKNYGSDCFAFVQWMSDHRSTKKRLNWREAIEYLANRADIKLEEEKYSEVYRHIRRQANAYAANLIDPIRRYLHGRGLDDNDLKEWTIGFDGKRITFPLPDRYRQLIGFSNRKIGCKDEHNPKYKNSATSEWFNKSTYLYGIHLYDGDFEEIRITEGTVDVILGKKYKVNNLMAPLGTSFTVEHALAIKNMGKIPCFCMDGDEAGVKAAQRAIEMMAELDVYSKVLFLPSGMDMADLANMLKDDTEQYIQDNAMTYWQYLMKDVVTQYDAKLNELKLKLYPSVKKIIGSIQNEAELVVMKDFVKNRMGLEL
jgi:DNA primase